MARRHGPDAGSAPTARRVAAVAALFTALALAACGTTVAPVPDADGGGAGTSTSAPRAAPSTATPTATPTDSLAPSPLPPTPVRPVSAQPTEPDGGLACPRAITDRRGLTVPASPQGVDGRARLLPDRAPTSLVVCGYPVMDIRRPQPLTAPFALAHRALATAEQQRDVVALLSWAPRGSLADRPCTAMAGDETAYLVGAAYGDAVVWVAALADANHCADSTNGDFVSRAPLGNDLDARFGRRAPMNPAPSPCGVSRSGRLGDDRTLAPAGDPAATVCRAGMSGEQALDLTADQSRQVVAALRALPTRPTGSTCQGRPGQSPDARFTLVLRYAVGPPAVVEVNPACRPAVLGGGLEADDAGPVAALVSRWSSPGSGADPNGSVSSGNPARPDPTTSPSAGAGSKPSSGSDSQPGSGAPDRVEPAPPAPGSPVQRPGAMPTR